ncbi:FTR1 family protein [Escherichia coli]
MSTDVGIGRRWVQCWSCYCGGVRFPAYWGGIRLNLGAFFKWTSLFILFVAAGLAAGAIRAFHEAGLWNHFQEIAFDMSAVLSTHSLFGTLMEGIFGYQEAPSVSEVAVWFIYLIPALVAFALPPRAGATASLLRVTNTTQTLA